MKDLIKPILKALKILIIALVSIVLGLFLIIAICNCDVPNYTLISHYRDDANFINDTATVTHIEYSEYSGSIVIAFTGLREAYQYDCFEIPVDVAESALKSTILEKIKVGDEVTFTSDPWYYGDGYIIPIVAIWSAEGEPLLEYEEGYANLMKWLEE